MSFPDTCNWKASEGGRWISVSLPVSPYLFLLVFSLNGFYELPKKIESS